MIRKDRARFVGSALIAAMGTFAGVSGSFAANPDSLSTGAVTDSLRVVLEPGLVLPNGDALLPLRIASVSGSRRRVEDCAIALQVDGEPTPFEVVNPTSALILLVDPRAIPSAEREEWAGAIAQALARDSARPESPAPRVFFCGDRAHEGDASPAAVLEALGSPTPSRLFDGILETMGALSSRPSALERHVVIVIASGEESRESRHPLVTCIGAADTARVAVHVVLVGGGAAGAAESRLRELAVKTGGATHRASGSPRTSLAAAIARVLETQALRFGSTPSQGTESPGRRSVRVLAPDALPALGSVAVRTSLGIGERRPFPWILSGAGVALLGAAGWLFVRRTRSLGHLVIIEGAPEASIPVTHHGVTLGGAKGNRLVLDDSRISRNHAVIQVRGREVTLVDLKSTNGTSVNGKRVSTQVLRSGDRILLAEAVELVYEERGWSRKRGGGTSRDPSAASVVSPAKRRGANDLDDEDDE